MYPIHLRVTVYSNLCGKRFSNLLNNRFVSKNKLQSTYMIKYSASILKGIIYASMDDCNHHYIMHLFTVVYFEYHFILLLK